MIDSKMRRPTIRGRRSCIVLGYFSVDHLRAVSRYDDLLQTRSPNVISLSDLMPRKQRCQESEDFQDVQFGYLNVALYR